MPILEWSPQILIAELSDEPQFSEDVTNLLRRLDEAGDNPPDVALNLSDVTYLNSSNIAQMLKLRTKLNNTSRQMRVCCVDDSVWSVLLITGLDKIFHFDQDIATSLASLQMQRKQ